MELSNSIHLSFPEVITPKYTRLFLLPTRRNLKFGKTLLHAAKQQIQQVASSDLERLAENG